MPFQSHNTKKDLDLDSHTFDMFRAIDFGDDIN